MKTIKQFVYPRDNFEGNILEQYPEVSHIGIQGAPGLSFELNGGVIKIGKTGIYELDLEGVGIINSLKFSPSSQDKIIVDIVYERGRNT